MKSVSSREKSIVYSKIDFQSTGSKETVHADQDSRESRNEISVRRNHRIDERESLSSQQLSTPSPSAQFDPSTPLPKYLSWRSDPSKSFSDWTIEVARIENNDVVGTDVYHCHSNVMAWGPRSSKRFVRLFQERMKKVPTTAHSRIILPVAEAEAFPMLLDFLYCESTLNLTADTVCSLYLLAHRFGIPMLQSAIRSFVEQGLDLEQSLEFLAIAHLQENDDALHELVLFTNSKICGFLVKYPEEASQVPPAILAYIVTMRSQALKVLKGENPRKYSGGWEVERSRQLSSVVAMCCHSAIYSGSYKLSRQTFDTLVDPNHLPALDAASALKLLEVDNLLRNQNKNENTQNRERLARKREMTYFETKCLQALASGWREAVRDGGFVDVAELAGINSIVLAELLVAVSKQYKEDLRKAEDVENRSRDVLALTTVKTNDPVQQTVKQAKSIERPFEEYLEKRSQGRLVATNHDKLAPMQWETAVAEEIDKCMPLSPCGFMDPSPSLSSTFDRRISDFGSVTTGQLESDINSEQCKTETGILGEGSQLENDDDDDDEEVTFDKYTRMEFY